MESMLDLALDVRRITVNLLGGTATPREVVLFLPPTDPRGPSGLLGRLNDGDAFLPASVDGAIQLLSKASLAAVAPISPLPEDSESEAFAAPSAELLVRLRGGIAFSGSVALVLPQDKKRLLDFLNRPERFFPMATPSGNVFVNRGWIEAVEPREVR